MSDRQMCKLRASGPNNGQDRSLPSILDSEPGLIGNGVLSGVGEGTLWPGNSSG